MADTLHKSGRPKVDPDWKQSNVTYLDLGELGLRLKTVDKLILEIAAKRIELAQRVEEFKRLNKEKIYREQTETSRLSDAQRWAVELGLNPEFARALLYLYIGESCKAQMIQLQDMSKHLPSFPDEASATEWYKEQLLELTRLCAESYDERYSETFFATKLYLDFESQVIAEVVKDHLERKRVALDLGCATGRQSFLLSRFFHSVVGYDISPDMIRVTKRKKEEKGLKSNLVFEIADIEEGIPYEDGKADLVVMGMGFASDIHKIGFVLSEIERVLTHKGLAVLSFYNRSALIYSWQFIPWPISLTASINLQRHCLDVHWKEETGQDSKKKISSKIFSVYAKPYTINEVESILPSHLPVICQYTFPTIASILPDVLLSDPAVLKSVFELDRQLANQENGAYTLVVIKKP